MPDEEKPKSTALNTNDTPVDSPAITATSDDETWNQSVQAAAAWNQPVAEEPVFNQAPEAVPTALTGPIAFGSGVNETPLTTSYQTTDEPALYSDQAPLPSAAKKSNKRRNLLIAGIIAGVLVVLGAGSVLAYNFVYQNPENVVGEAMANALVAKSVTATGTIDSKSDDFGMKVTLKGKANQEGNGHLAATMKLYTDDVDLTVDGEAVYTKDGTLYVKVNNVRELADTYTKDVEGADFSAFDSVIEKIDGRWIKIAKEDLGDFDADYEKTQKCYADVSNKLQSDKAATKELTELYKANKFISVEKKLGSKDINGVGSLGYVLKNDETKMVAFIEKLENTTLGKDLKACDEDVDFKQFAKDLKKSEDDQSTVTNEVWVSRFGHEFTELKLATKEDDAESSFLMQPTFNAAVSVDVPQDPLSLDELQTEIENATTQYYSNLFSEYENPTV